MRDRMARYGLVEVLGADAFYDTVTEAYQRLPAGPAPN